MMIYVIDISISVKYFMENESNISVYWYSKIYKFYLSKVISIYMGLLTANFMAYLRPASSFAFMKWTVHSYHLIGFCCCRVKTLCHA